MYAIARLLLIVAVLCGFYCFIVLICLGWPETGWLLAIVGFVRYGRKGYAYATSLGSARWATEREVAGMIDADSGLYLGRLV